MEFGKSFTYVFEDDDWIVKILLAAVIAFIPIVGMLAVAGWGVEITKRAINKDPELLPDWSDFVNYLIKGLVVILIGFVYLLPVILISACTSAPLLADLDSDTEVIFSFIGICFACFSFIYSILVFFLIAAAIGRYADTGEIGSAFQFGKVFATVKAAPAAYLMVLVGGFLAGMIAFAGIIACVIGVFFTMAYANAINAHLTGQAYYEAKLVLSGNNDELAQVALDSN